MKVVILAGGLGTRISEESQFKPKPMIEIGGKPILWHIMKEYSYYGFNEFVICAGYKQHIIKEWFSDYFLHNSDVTFDYTNGHNEVTVHNSNIENWKVTVVDTGLHTMTGGRIKRIQKYIGNETFLMTYGDGVCDVDIFILDIGGDNAVKSFREKNLTDGVLINAGYMVLESSVFDLIKGDETVFEREPLERLVKDGELMSYKHKGFWQCMDNVREMNMLEQLYSKGVAPWKKW